MRTRPRLALAITVAVCGVLVAATPVPQPPEVRPGAAEPTGLVTWVPGVQQVAGRPGEVVAVDLALEDGTAHEVRAALSVREVDVDPVRGPELGRTSRLVTLATDAVTLRPGDRVLLRGTATVPDRPVLVGIEAALLGAADAAAPSALVLLGPATPVDLAVTVDLGADTATATVHNRSDVPGLFDARLRGTRWGGSGSDRTIRGLAIAAGGTRELTLALPAGVGRRQVDVAVAALGGETVHAGVSAWSRTTVPAAVALVLVLVAGAAAVAAWRRRRDRPRAGDDRPL